MTPGAGAVSGDTPQAAGGLLGRLTQPLPCVTTPCVKHLSVLGLSAVVFLGACSDSSGGPSDTSAESVNAGDGGSSNEPGDDAGDMTSVSTGADSGGTSAGDTWATFSQEFFDTYCVECHGAGNATRDYTLLDQVERDADEIRCGVAVDKIDGCPDFPPPRQFPIGMGAKPSDDERNRVVAWIEAGTPE